MLGLYAQDQWTIKQADAEPRRPLRLPECLQPGADAGRAAAFLGPINFPAVNNVPNWKDISPRLGAT